MNIKKRVFKMDKIFAKENQVLEEAEKLIENNGFDSDSDCEKYRSLYEEYRTLLRQTVKVVHLADLVQHEMKTVSMELEKVSRTDALTNLYNRMYFMKKYIGEWKNAVRNGTSMGLLMIDIDFFKEYNDTYGHVPGDHCLQAVAKQLNCNRHRPRDVAGRFGGDEFVVLLPETDLSGAEMVAKNLLKDICRLDIEHKGALLYGKVTLSIGISSVRPKSDDRTESLIQCADQALYQAKKDGRNCFRVLAQESFKAF